VQAATDCGLTGKQKPEDAAKGVKTVLKFMLDPVKKEKEGSRTSACSGLRPLMRATLGARGG